MILKYIRMCRALMAGALLFGFLSISQAASFSFTGTFNNDAEVQLFDFTVGLDSQVTMLTLSYAGGENAAGEVISRGGFDPILSLFDSTGELIGANDDGEPGEVPVDSKTGVGYDTYLSTFLMAGDYKVAVTQYDNMARGPFLSDGFLQNRPDFTTTVLPNICPTTMFCDYTDDQRENFWAFDILNVDSASLSPVPVPGAVWLFGTALLGFIGFSKRGKQA